MESYCIEDIVEKSKSLTYKILWNDISYDMTIFILRVSKKLLKNVFLAFFQSLKSR